MSTEKHCWLTNLKGSKWRQSLFEKDRKKLLQSISNSFSKLTKIFFHSNSFSMLTKNSFSELKVPDLAMLVKIKVHTQECWCCWDVAVAVTSQYATHPPRCHQPLAQLICCSQRWRWEGYWKTIWLGNEDVTSTTNWSPTLFQETETRGSYSN